MKRAMGHAALSASMLGRLSGFDMADLGPHASLFMLNNINNGGGKNDRACWQSGGCAGNQFTVKQAGMWPQISDIKTRQTAKQRRA